MILGEWEGARGKCDSQYLSLFAIIYGCYIFQMSNNKVAESIGFEPGTYEVNTSVLQSSFQEFATNDTGKFETFKQRDITKQKRPNSVEVMTGPSSELPTKRFKSILPNDKKSNIVMSTQGNIVLMGTSQTTSSSPQRVLLVNNAQTPQTNSNPLIVVNKNQSNSSAAVLECVQSQPTSIMLGINQSQPSSVVPSNQLGNSVVNQTATVVSKQTITPKKEPVVVATNSIAYSKMQNVVLNSKTATLPRAYSCPTKSQTVVSSSKPSSILQTAKSNPVKSSGITILPINNSTGFNSVGTISSVYNTSLLSSTSVQKQSEVVSSAAVLPNNISLLSSVISTEGVIIAENGISTIADTTNYITNTTDSVELQIVKSEIDDENALIISDFNSIDHNKPSESIVLVNTNDSLENPSTEQIPMRETLMETNHMESTEMVQFVDDQIVAGDQVNPLDNIITASNIYQTPEGIIIIQNQDGSTVQLQGSDGEPIPLETVQALLEGQYLQTADDGVILNQ